MTESIRDWMDDPEPETEETSVTPVEARTSRSLDEQVRKVADQRRHLQGLNSVLDEKREAFERDNRDLADQIEKAKRQVKDGETVLKTMALHEYQETGDVSPAPGIKIRRKVEVQYDDHDAINWCRENESATECLKLDKRKFDSIAKSLALPFVSKDTVSQVALSRDLDSALDGAA